MRLHRIASAFRIVPSRLFSLAIAVILFTATMAASEPVYMVIELYGSGDNVQYAFVSNLQINGKVDLRECSGNVSEPITGSAYGKLSKRSMQGATALERMADGTLVLIDGGGAHCVVPANLHNLGKKTSYTRSDLVDMGPITGQAAGPDGQPQPLHPLERNAKLIFIGQIDFELAEYLRAERANTVKLWQNYLVRYSQTPPTAILNKHLAAANMALATLLTQEGSDHLLRYRSSLKSDNVDYEDLRLAKLRADQAKSTSPNYAPATKLQQETVAEFAKIGEQATGELQSYQDALHNRQHGYDHLLQARTMADHLADIAPQADSTQRLRAAVEAEQQAIEGALRKAKEREANPDDALATIGAYRGFDEEPRIAAIIDAAYRRHIDQGDQAMKNERYERALREYKAALAVRQSDDVAKLVEQATIKLNQALDSEAVQAAVTHSDELRLGQKFIEAYDTLMALPERLRPTVAEQIEKIKPDYVKAAIKRVADLRKMHETRDGRLLGPADEIGIRQAIILLTTAADLNDDQDLRTRVDIMNEELSKYYVNLSRSYFNKPLGSGVGLGWMYLGQAQLYRPDEGSIRDEMTKQEPIYHARSRMLIRIAFHDQTPRHDSQGLPDQLSDAVITGLEASGQPLQTTSENTQRDTGAPMFEPTFTVTGEVMDHRIKKDVTPISTESHFLAGTHDVPNDDWNKFNRECDDLNMRLQAALKSENDAKARGKHKEIELAQEMVIEAQNNLDAARRKLDSIPRTKPVDIIRPYYYTLKKITLSASEELRFRIANQTGGIVSPVQTIRKANSKTFELKENVKAEDSEGVRESGAYPDENQYQTDTDIEARDALVKAVCEAAAKLPAFYLDRARARLQVNDADGAAEAYISYLNSTAKAETAERTEALNFLKKQYNLQNIEAYLMR